MGKRKRSNADLDDVMASLEARESRDAASQQPNGGANKVLIGSVEQFFDKISVVAIKLTGNLKVGDIIEIGSEDDAIRQRVSSMQIDRVNVEEANDGDSIGIKLKHRVSEGESIYRIR